MRRCALARHLSWVASKVRKSGIRRMYVPFVSLLGIGSTPNYHCLKSGWILSANHETCLKLFREWQMKKVPLRKYMDACFQERTRNSNICFEISRTEIDVQLREKRPNEFFSKIYEMWCTCWKFSNFNQVLLENQARKVNASQVLRPNF